MRRSRFGVPFFLPPPRAGNAAPCRAHAHGAHARQAAAYEAHHADLAAELAALRTARASLQAALDDTHARLAATAEQLHQAQAQTRELAHAKAVHERDGVAARACIDALTAQLAEFKTVLQSCVRPCSLLFRGK